MLTLPGMTWSPGILGTTAAVAVVPLFGQPHSLAATDSGLSSSDGITNFDNSSAATALEFLVPNTVDGYTVTIYSDGMKQRIELVVVS